MHIFLKLVARPIADPGVASYFHGVSFMEIDHKIFSTIFLLLPLIQEGLVSVTSVSTVISEIFVRVLFARNFAYAKFHENKTLAIWLDHSVIY